MLIIYLMDALQKKAFLVESALSKPSASGQGGDHRQRARQDLSLSADSVPPAGAQASALLKADKKEQKSLVEGARSFAFTTQFKKIAAWGQRNSLWPMPYGTACCGIEMMSVMGPRYDLARFGAEVVRFSPPAVGSVDRGGHYYRKNGARDFKGL